MRVGRTPGVTARSGCALHSTHAAHRFLAAARPPTASRRRRCLRPNRPPKNAKRARPFVNITKTTRRRRLPTEPRKPLERPRRTIRHGKMKRKTARGNEKNVDSPRTMRTRRSEAFRELITKSRRTPATRGTRSLRRSNELGFNADRVLCAPWEI